jgi:predicted porin
VLKKSIFAGAVTLVVASAHGQTQNVTISGVLGAGMSYTNNASYPDGGGRMQQGGTHAIPFIAFTGREDLGGGASAIFKWSNYIALDTGGSSPFETFVGLSSRNWGTVTLGNQYDLLADLVPYTSERFTSNLATHPGNLDRTVGNPLNSLVKYKSPEMKGFQFGAQYGYGKPTSTTNNGNTMGFSASYSSNPWQFLAVWENVHDVPYSPRSSLGVPTLYGIDLVKNPTTKVAQDQNTASAGVVYSDGGWRLMGNYSYTRLSALGMSAKAQTIDVGAYKYVTAALRLGGGYAYTKLENYKWNVVHAHADYALSKRTSLYALSVFQAAGQAQVAAMRFQPIASTNRQVVFEVGITHVF